MARARITGQDDSVTRAVRSSAIEQLSARAYTVPTDAPEADGTLSWEATRFFQGLPELTEGALIPDPERAGHGLELRDSDVERYQV